MVIPIIIAGVGVGIFLALARRDNESNFDLHADILNEALDNEE